MARFSLCLFALFCLFLVVRCSSNTEDVEVKELEDDLRPNTSPLDETGAAEDETLPHAPKGHPSKGPGSPERDSKCPVMNSYRFAKRKIVPALVSAVQALPMPQAVKNAFNLISQAFSLPAPTPSPAVPAEPRIEAVRSPADSPVDPSEAGREAAGFVLETQ